MSEIDELIPPGGWITTGKVRIPPPPPSERGLMFRGISHLSRFLGRSQVPDVFSVLQINGRLFWPWLLFASRLMPYGRLDARTRELIILRTAWNCRSRYEWGQHLEIALRSGANDNDIVRVTQGAESFYSAQDKAVMQACDELCREKAISDATWAALKESYSIKVVIEIVMLVGHYVMLAGFLNSTGIQLESSLESELISFGSRII